MFMEKRGASHVEIILAFVLFIAVVGFALYFFYPGNSDRVVDSTMDYTFREIKKNASVEIESYDVKIIGTSIPDPLAIQIAKINNEKKARVKDVSGTVLSSKIEDGTDNDFVYIGSTALTDGDIIFIDISDDFTAYSPSPGTAVHDGDKYTIISYDSEEMISEKRIALLKSKYDSDYLNLKREFNLPDRANFGFVLDFGTRPDITAERNIASGLEVFTARERVKVLNSDGEAEFAELTISIW